MTYTSASWKRSKHVSLFPIRCTWLAVWMSDASQSRCMMICFSQVSVCDMQMTTHGPYVAQPASFAWVVDIYIYGNLFWFGFLSPTRSAIFRAGLRYYLGEKSIWQIFRQYLESRPWRWIRRFIIWNTSAIVWSRKIADHIAVLVSEIMSLVSLCLSRRLVHSAVKNVSFHYLKNNCKWP